MATKKAAPASSAIVEVKTRAGRKFTIRQLNGQEMITAVRVAGSAAAASSIVVAFSLASIDDQPLGKLVSDVEVKALQQRYSKRESDLLMIRYQQAFLEIEDPEVTETDGKFLVAFKGGRTFRLRELNAREATDGQRWAGDPICEAQVQAVMAIDQIDGTAVKSLGSLQALNDRLTLLHDVELRTLAGVFNSKFGITEDDLGNE